MDQFQRREIAIDAVEAAIGLPGAETVFGLEWGCCKRIQAILGHQDTCRRYPKFGRTGLSWQIMTMQPADALKSTSMGQRSVRR